MKIFTFVCSLIRDWWSERAWRRDIDRVYKYAQDEGLDVADVLARQQSPCPDCKGRGELFGFQCAYCDGMGRVPLSEGGNDLND